MFRFTLKSASAAVAAVLLSAPNSRAEDEAPPTHLPEIPAAAPVVPVVPVAPIVPPAPWPVAFPDLFAPLAPAPVLAAPLDPVAPPPAEAPAALPPAALPEPQPVAPVAPCPCEGGFDWKKVPRVRPMPRLGFFPVLPTGPGYYSALDQLRGVCLNAPPKYPYPRFGAIPMSFFDVDNFSYLDDPNNTEHDFFDPLKRVRLGNNWLFTTGGEFRWRYENAYNDRLGQRDNSYDLTRTRIYTDLWYRDAFRLYVEYIGAWSSFQDLPPLPIDQNKSDFLNLFVDLKLADLGGDPAYLRIGRQELLFGSQRLISPLDWANTRRTFQGVRGFRHTDNWDFDLFWVQPVAINANRFDSVDNNQNFVGAWATYRPNKAQAIDAYYLMLDNTNVVRQLGIPRGNFTRHTIGGRYSGTGQNNPNVLFDTETAFQFGSQNGRDVFAAMTTQGLGYNWKDAPWNPTVWAYYDFASGGRNGAGTFNQLFAFGHYYLGWIDQVGRQNIHDLNFHLYLYPTKWITAWTQFHSFWLADPRDALYNAAGNAIRRDPTGRAGQHVGEELDFVLNFHLSKHADLLTGYCHLWGGDFLHNTASRTNAQNTGLYFLQLGYRW